MTNADMKAGRFLRWHEARKMVEWMRSCWDRGLTVYMVTAYRSTAFAPKHCDCVKATRTGVYVRIGKNWLCATYCKFVAQ